MTGLPGRIVVELTDRQREELRHYAQAAAAQAVAAAPPTQVRRPWRATVRTSVQALISVCAMLPVLVGASGLDETAPAVAGVLAVAAGLTRIMALRQVEAFLQRFLPWLAAEPRPPAPF